MIIRLYAPFSSIQGILILRVFLAPFLFLNNINLLLMMTAYQSKYVFSFSDLFLLRVSFYIYVVL